MEKERMLPADVFKVVNKSIIKSYENKVITMLYQPIIGGLATSLYFTLISYLDKMEVESKEWSHYHLMTSLGVSLEEIKCAKEKLEAIGLLRTYVKKDSVHEFIYEIYSPVDASEFLNNPLLSTLLCNTVGELEYKNKIEYFSLPSISLKDYKEVTSSFQEVFQIVNDVDFEELEVDIKKRNTNKIDITSNLKMEEVLSNIPDEILKEASIKKEDKDFLYRMSFVYGMEKDELIEIIKSSSKRGVLDKEAFKENAKNHYKFEHLGKLPSLALKNQPEYLRKQNKGTSLREKKIYEFETISPHDFLYSKHLGKRITSSEVAILEYLLVEMKLNPGVVNVILDYVLKESDNKLVPAYVESVAGLFSRNKITTVEEAMELALKEHEKRKHKKKQEIRPSWIDKNFKEEDVDEKEIKRISEMIESVVQ